MQRLDLALGRSVAYLTFHEPDNEAVITDRTEPAAADTSTATVTAAPVNQPGKPDGGKAASRSSAAVEVLATESKACGVGKPCLEDGTSEKGVMLFDATAELTPVSVVPMTFSPESTARRSGASSDAFPAESPASSSVGGRSRYHDKSLQRFSGGDPNELRLEPLDIFSEDEGEV